MALPRALAQRVIAFASKIDLGRKPMGYCGVACGPTMPQPKVWYPNLWIEGVEQPINLPDTGKATIEYKVTRRTTTDVDGKQRHEASLEVHSIEPAGEGKNGKSQIANGKGSDRAKAVKLSSLLAPGLIQFSRARNTDGEFAPQADETPDPSTMRAAYGPVVRGNKLGAAKVAAGAAAGLGGTAAAALMLARKLRKR